jgi:SAM-dependent methyltransferase
MISTQGAQPRRPNAINRLRSRQAGLPTGLLGRFIGRVMVKDTATSNDRALELLELVGTETVLEVGFGQGRTVAKLLEQGHHVLGVEASDTMVKQATARNRHACNDRTARLVLGDGMLIPYDDSSADAAFTAHTIYFMSEPDVTIAEVARVLGPGGRFVIACRVAEDGMPSWMDPSIYHIPTSPHVKEMLHTAGFETVVHHSGDATTHWTHWFVAALPQT